MKLSLAPVVLATVVAAAPGGSMEKRQSSLRDRLSKGKSGSGSSASGETICLVFARGSTEPSPLGILLGPPLQRALKQKFPSMITVPVLYAASIATNVSVARTDQASINKGVQAFKEADGKCGIIIAGGYSQGAAVMHNVIEKALDDSIKQKIAGVALYGSTRNKQDGGHIKNFPTEKSKTWCNKNDGVCGGGLTVNAGHLSYGTGTIRESADYLAAQVASFKSGSGSSSSGSSPKASKGKTSKSSGAAKAGKGKGKTPKAAEPVEEAAVEEAPAEEAAAEPAAEEVAEK